MKSLKNILFFLNMLIAIFVMSYDLVVGIEDIYFIKTMIIIIWTYHMTKENE